MCKNLEDFAGEYETPDTDNAEKAGLESVITLMTILKKTVKILLKLERSRLSRIREYYVQNIVFKINYFAIITDNGFEYFQKLPINYSNIVG